MTQSIGLSNKNNSLARFQQATQAVHASQTLDKVLTRVIAELCSALEAEAASVALIDHKEQDLLLYAAGPVAHEIHGLRLPIDQGIVGWVVRTGNSALVNDASNDRRFFSAIDSETGFTTRSIMCVPLVIGSKTIGAVEVLNKRQGAFDKEDVAFLKVFSSVAASAIENATLYKQAQDRLRELTALYQVSRVVTTATDIKEIYAHLVVQTAGLIDAENCALYVYDAAQGALLCQTPPYGPMAETMARFRLPLDPDGLIKQVLDAPEPLLSNDLASEAGLDPFRPLLEQLGARSILGCAIVIDQDEFGLLVAINKGQQAHFSEQDRRLAAIMTQQATMALQRVHFQQQQQRDAFIQAALLEVSQALSSLTHLEKLVEFVAQITHRLVGCDHCVTCLWDKTALAFVARGQSGLSPDMYQAFRQLFFKLGDLPSLDQCISTRSPVLMTEQKISQTAPVWAGKLFGSKSCILVPLVTQRRTIGSIIAAYTRTARSFKDWEIDLIIGIARQAAVAIENASLYQELQSHSKELEQTLHERQEADERKTLFIQNVSHELRTPLTFIKGYTELLLEGQMGDLDTEQNKGLREIAEKTSQLCRLVDDVITLQTIDASVLERYPIDLRIPINTATQQVLHAAKQAGVQLQIQVADNLPMVQADGPRIHQALKHLLENAIKFSPNGGPVIVRASRQENALCIEVADHGVGIPPEAIPFIFDRFYQVDGSTTRRFGGTGLGLAIVQQIVEAHGGRIWVQSQGIVGLGSVFFFTLPL